MPTQPAMIETETAYLVRLLQDDGYHIEDIGGGSDGSSIINVLRDGGYALTLTISRTPGH